MNRSHEDGYERGKQSERRLLEGFLAEGDTPQVASAREAANIAEDLANAQNGYERATDERGRDFWSRQVAYFEGQKSVLD